MLREYERAVVFRLGRMIATKGPGLVLLVPAIDRMVRVSLRTVTLNVPPQDVITRDNVTARVDAVVYFRVVDPNCAVVQVESFLKATSQIAQTTLRSVLGKADLDTLLSEREELNEELQKIIDEQTEPWGVKVTTVEIKDVGIPQAMQHAMARQAQAERERRAKVINAEGEFQAAARLSEAADVISQEPDDDPAALPADAERDRGQPELDGRVPAADGPDQAAARGEGDRREAAAAKELAARQRDHRRSIGRSRQRKAARRRRSDKLGRLAMDLLEYQGKQLFARHGVPVPSGAPATTVEEAVAAADEIGYPCVVKAQVQIGGRGKAGGIKVAQNRQEAEEHSKNILGMDIRGHTVHEVWIEAASDIAAEYYASIVFDRSAKRPLVMLSTQGGMDIEEVADKDPTAIARLHVDPLLGFQDFHARRLAFEAGVDADVVRPIGALLNKLYDAFVDEEAMLVEVNPLIVTGDRKVAALDAKVTLDDNSLFRHPDNASLRNVAAEDEQERMARERGLTFVKLDGNVGILGNGAGLVMSTLDVVAQAGGRPANFLDAGGGSRAEAITQAVEVILSNENVTAVLFNIFGGITRCDEVAKGLIEAFDQIKPTVPFVVRLDGTNDKEGRALLAEANLPNVHTEATMLGAAKKVVELAG